ncbi:DUF3800 domain-containing protein [Schumannella luteola]|uniref:DUF3800 domain-containing protein n=1 Tax=Schumannella luteola TaxID=472059 RepID=A0A852Y9S7_9MICO|nr:DUF3800 domain-containing protein [Schumannella luteola]NYG98044.1 hypothetical protein [Schumannella luteola]
MLIAYLDEFGHVGPFVEDRHPKFGQHPVFGYAGFIIPAENARRFGGDFKRVKTSLFKTEIDKSSNPAQWERKGNEYFSTGSITRRPEQLRAFSGLMRQLRGNGGRLFYYGDEKMRGTLKQTGRTSTDITEHALSEAINRICTHADSVGDDVLILTDSITEKSRIELVAKMYAHIYSRRRAEMKRIVEAPLHVESQLNSGIQMADWICGLIGRLAHFHLLRGSEFEWATNLKPAAASLITHESKLHLTHGPELHNAAIFNGSSHRHGSRPANTIAGRIPNLDEIYQAALRSKTSS